MYSDGDALLFVLSAWRETGWVAFKRAFDELQRRRLRRQGATEGEPARFERVRAARLLASLGHCDADFRGGSTCLFVAPAMLAALPSPGLPRAVLCGVRSPETVATLHKACAEAGQAVRIEITSQWGRAAYAPSRIEVEGESHQVLQHLAEKLRISYAPVPPAWTITELSGSLEEYLDSLQWSSEPEVNWEREDFAPELLQFATPTGKNEGLRLSRYEDPVRLRWTYRLWREQQSTEVEPAWGRFAILQAASKRVLLYDNRAGVVAVPRGTPLPSLLDRALALCSGYAPKLAPRAAVRADSPERFGFDLYMGVPPDVFAVVASRVGQGENTELLVLEGDNE